MERDFKGIWIPAEIWLSKDLTTMEKLFLVEIDSLDNKEGCFASNKYFSDFFDISKGRCSQIINSLKDKGYITIKYQREGKQIKNRIINSCLKVIKFDPTLVSKLNTPYLENDKGVFRKCVYPYLENAKENNTLSNNTRDIYSAFEEAWKSYPHKKGKTAVNKKNKEAIEKIGKEAILQAVSNYIQDVENQRANGFKDLRYMNGSTFFNGRYLEYMDSSSITPRNNQARDDYFQGLDLGITI